MGPGIDGPHGAYEDMNNVAYELVQVGGDSVCGTGPADGLKVIKLGDLGVREASSGGFGQVKDPVHCWNVCSGDRVRVCVFVGGGACVG